MGKRMVTRDREPAYLRGRIEAERAWAREAKALPEYGRSLRLQRATAAKLWHADALTRELERAEQGARELT
jgi:hypothetical protein